MRRILVLVVTLLMISSNFAFAEQDGPFTFSINGDGTATLTDYDPSLGGDNPTIPERVYGSSLPTTGATVVKIGSDTFKETGIHSATVPVTVKEIESRAFYWNAMESIYIPDTVTNLREAAFEQAGLKSVRIPTSIREIKDKTFMSNRLTSLNIPDNIVTIGELSFWSNDIEELTIGKNVKTIKYGAFRSNPLKKIHISGSIEKIEDDAFGISVIEKSIHTVTFDEGITEITQYLFNNAKLAELNLPNSLKVIGYSSFSKNKIESLHFGNGIETIGPYAFKDNQLKSIDLPTSVLKIERGAFAGNPLTTFNLPPEKYGYKTVWTNFNEGKQMLPGDSVTDLNTSYVANREKIYLNGPVEVKGIPQIGHELVATGAKTNMDTLVYAWYRDDVKIEDATSKTYISTIEDLGHTIKVKISCDPSVPSIEGHLDSVILKKDAVVKKGIAPKVRVVTKYYVELVPIADYEYLCVLKDQSIASGKWQDSPKFDGLTKSTQYDFYQRMKETSTHQASEVSEKLRVRTSSSSHSKSSSTSSSSSLQQSEEKKVEHKVSVKATVSKDDKGHLVAVAKVDESTVKNEMKTLSEKENIIVEVKEKFNDVEVGLSLKSLNVLQQKDASVEIRSDRGNYILPSKSINKEQLDELFGAIIDASKVDLKVKIKETSKAVLKVIENKTKSGVKLLVAPVSFQVEATYNGQTKEVKNMNIFVTRMIPLPEDLDVNLITTGVVIEEDGTLRPVPTMIVTINGKHYAKINSVTNSLYTVIERKATYEKIKGHWAEKEISEMMNAFIIDDETQKTYHPNNVIRRDAFAQLLVKALGLKPEVTDVFSDLENNPAKNYINAAYRYGLVNGTSATTFSPNETITREQAATMIHNVLKLTEQDKESDPLLVTKNQTLSVYEDAYKISSYAKTSINWAVENKIISGKTKISLAPKDNITCAESVVMINRLLKALELK